MNDSNVKIINDIGNKEKVDDSEPLQIGTFFSYFKGAYK